MLSSRAGFITLIALMTLFPAAVAVTAAVNGWHPQGLRELRCPGYVEWQNSTLNRVDRAEALVDELNSEFRWNTPWGNIENQFQKLSEDQEASDAPPALNDMNEEFVELFEIYERDARGRKNGVSASAENAQERLDGFVEKNSEIDKEISSRCDFW